MLHVPLLGETLDIEVQRVVDLLVEQHSTGLTAARTRWSRAEARHKPIRHEIPVVKTAVVEGLEAALC